MEVNPICISGNTVRPGSSSDEGVVHFGAGGDGADPQRFLAECVALSDGEISDVRNLRAEVVGEKPADKGSRSRAKKHAESKDE